VSAVPKLKHALTDSDSSVCCAACLALGQIASQPACAAQAATTVQALSRRLRETDSGVRKAAATALGHFGMHAMPALPALTERIKDSSHDVRKASAGALSMLGEHAAPALSALTELQNDSNEDVRKVAASAIADIQRRLSTANQDLDGEDIKPASFGFLSYYKFARPQADFLDSYESPSQSGEEEQCEEEGGDAPAT
jgi:HEAT repeat protein